MNKENVYGEIRLNTENPVSSATTMLSCLYLDREQQKILFVDHSWTVRELDAAKPIDPKKTAPNDIPISGENPFQLRVPEHGTKDGIKKLVSFIKNHIDVSDFNAPDFEYGGTSLLIEVFQESSDKEIVEADLYNECYEVVRAMSEAELLNTCFYLQVAHPDKMSEKELRAALVGTRHGKLHPTATTAHKKFLEVFGPDANSVKADEARIEVYVRKALASQYIKNENGTLRIGSVMVGLDIEQVVVYMRENKAMYDAMVNHFSRSGDKTAKAATKSATDLAEKMGATEIEFMKNEIIAAGGKTKTTKPEAVYKAYVETLTEKGEKALSQEEVIAAANKPVANSE